MSNEHPLLIVGSGGHAGVLAEIIKARKMQVVGVVSLEGGTIKGYPEYSYLGGDEIIENYSPADIRLVNAVGAVSVEKNILRERLFVKFKEKGYRFATLIHPTAVVATTTVLGEGVQIMAGAIIQPNTVVGDNTIINTAASVDHDCHVGNSVHIAPGARLSGNVKIGEKTHIGVGAVLIQGIEIGKEVMVCAGAIITKKVFSEVKVSSIY